MIQEITDEKILTFLEGNNPMEKVVSVECAYNDDQVSVIYYNENDVKCIKKVNFHPFLWAKISACKKLYGGDKDKLIDAMRKYGVRSKGLIYQDNNGNTTFRMENGYRILFYCTRPQSWQRFQQFFKDGGNTVYNRATKNTLGSTNKDFLSFSPIEQFMISSGMRMFKGFEDYDDLQRLTFDLETQGLIPEQHRIEQIGIRTNKPIKETGKPLETIITIEGKTEEELNINELQAIRLFLKILWITKPDVVLGQNSENFDWNFIIVRLKILGTSLEEETKLLGYYKEVYKSRKKNVLKLGGEVEYYFPTVIWGINVIDCLHGIRRVQAQDSNMKKADLKYVTKYLKLNKPNRVYIPGNKISTIWHILEEKFALNEKNGKWYEKKEDEELKEDFRLVSGRYLIERYLLDDLYETDKVELTCNQPDFLMNKFLPTTFSKACTMGTASRWKLLMTAWSYENDLAIPAYGTAKQFTGGLSRLLLLGLMKRVVKLDFNSLYPSIILTWLIKSAEDISGVMLKFLGFVLDNREKFKGLMKKAGKKADKMEQELIEAVLSLSEEEVTNLKKEVQELRIEQSRNSRKEKPFKTFGNSFFGGFGAPNIFNWGDLLCSEQTTCTGRQSFRLMLYYFNKRNYTAVVGDSVTYDTPLIIKYNHTQEIEVKTFEELFDESKSITDPLGREYDKSQKNYKVWCRSGWSDVYYIYRHKTDKHIHRVSTQWNGYVDVTEDHSIFNLKKEKQKPTELKIGQVLEISHFPYEYKKMPYYRGNVPLKKHYDSKKEEAIDNLLYRNLSIANIVSNLEDLGPTEEYVYDISLDGTFVNALGFHVLSNTDGINFQMPPQEQLDRTIYIGKGLNRNTEEGKEYKGVNADVAEFNDLYMRGKMGLGIDEYAPSTINFSRKNYADLLESGEIKIVGNSVKSKKMPIFIEKFINMAIELLLNDKGEQFLKEYYDYIDKIYNLQIPLRDIASVGKIKKTLPDYIKGCEEYTLAGQKKSRQAWYELAIKHEMNVNMGDSIYYINTGKSKSHADIKKITKHYILNEDGEKKYLDKIIEKAYKLEKAEFDTKKQEKIVTNDLSNKTIKKIIEDKFESRSEYMKKHYPTIQEEVELQFNCVLLDNKFFDTDEETFCDENFEYNVPKYISQFNSRIKVFLVCFSKEIRSQILISNPKDRKSFTENESKLVYGEPNNEIDQDSYHEILTMEDKEIDFWKRYIKTLPEEEKSKYPPFVEDYGMKWEDIERDYDERQTKLKAAFIKDEIKMYNK
ncbi:hypothetical protein EZS27_012453, partial [termite gut metagenome]